MRRPASANSIEGGDGNTQVGHNSGTITVGYTVQEHQDALEKALTDKTADLERAHGAERALLQSQMDTLKDKLADLVNDHKERLQELENAKRLLQRYDNQLNAEKRDAAFRALDAGETTLAQALLKELAQQASSRREDAAKEEAEFEFELGKLAEAEVRWLDAYVHYKRAAARHETVDHLKACARMTWRLAKGDEAVTIHKKLVDLAQAEHGSESAEYSSQINKLAVVVQAQGRYKEAETLFRQALEITRATLG